MCNSMLLPHIKQFKKQDVSVFEIIFDEFEKLINFYSHQIKNEDAKSELVLFFIELLYSIDLSRFKADCSNELKKYIAVCIRNRYIAIPKNEQKLKSYNVELFENTISITEDFENKILVEQMLKLLTKKQRLVLIYRYKFGFSDREIANILNIKRQAVNQLKNRAFEILRTKL